MIKFSHIADCHIGSWREEKLTELNFLAFAKAIDESIREKVDFILIAGDLFNTSMPSIDYVNKTVKELVKLKINNIPVFAIAGSHDFSPSGKTMLKVLESAKLLTNALQGKIINEKLVLEPQYIHEKKIMITGILGKKGTLERNYYDAIDYDDLYFRMNSKQDYFKIFMLHSALTELKPKELSDMPSQPISVLPKGFDYYAAGHVHYRHNSIVEELGRVVYPGPTFPNNFKELSELKYGSFSIVSVDDKKTEIKEINLSLKEIEFIKIDLTGKNTIESENIIFTEIDSKNIENKIVLLKIFGKMNANISDLNINNIINHIEEKNPFYIMKNTFSLEGKDELLISREYGNLEDIEKKIVSDNFDTEKIKYILELISRLSEDKKEGETVTNFEDRIIKDVMSSLLNE